MPRRPAPVPLPRELLDLAAGQRGLLTTAQLGGSGLGRSEVRSLARAGRLEPVFRSIWSLRPVAPLDHTLRVFAGRLLHADGVGCLDSCARIFGLPTPSGSDQSVHLTLPEREKQEQSAGPVLHWLRLQPGDVTAVAGVPVTTPVRLFLDASRRWSRDDAVALLDAAQRARLITPADITALAPRLSRRAVAWAGMADGAAESPLETRVRLLLVDAGLGGSVIPQYEVRGSDGRFLGRLDFAIPAARVGIECDGRDVHEAPEALFRDRHRADDLHAAGWRLVRVTGLDVRTQPADVVRRIRRALAAAA